MTNGVADKKQNEVSFGFLKGSDLGEREQEVLEDAAARTGFVPDRLIGRSAWWGSSEIGAFHWAGKFEGKRAVLKIQGVRPSVSEIYMIESFARNNKSKVIRPPFLYASIPWDEQRHYEALILEHIDGPKIIQTPTTTPQVKHFFELYLDYRQNCRHSPWVEKYEDSLSAHIADQFERWRDTSSKIYPNHPFRKEEDSSLIDSAVELLIREYKEVEPEYMHGHFSENDLYQVGDKVVVLSNLYWSWRQPLYDAVFGYHWFIYHLNTVERITSKMIEEQIVKFGITRESSGWA